MSREKQIASSIAGELTFAANSLKQARRMLFFSHSPFAGPELLMYAQKCEAMMREIEAMEERVQQVRERIAS